MHSPDFYHIAASRKFTAPPGFAWYRWEAIGPDAVILTGCVSSGLYAKGPRKGRPKYDGPPVRLVVTQREYEAEVARYESETGKCARCGGDGQAWAGWHHETGHEFKACRRCAATGKAKAA
jgi:hypothetical protein